jgi:hypothetical protein
MGRERRCIYMMVASCKPMKYSESVSSLCSQGFILRLSYRFVVHVNIHQSVGVELGIFVSHSTEGSWLKLHEASQCLILGENGTKG